MQLPLQLSVSEFDVADAGSSVSMNPSDEMWTLGVSMDIREAALASEPKDIESEVPNDEISESAEATCSQNCCCWVVW